MQNSNILDHSPPNSCKLTKGLTFGVDSQIPSFDLLQNNIDLFEWVQRNKLYPSFWGRNIDGDHPLSMREIDFLHNKACRIAIYCSLPTDAATEIKGEIFGVRMIVHAEQIGIPKGHAIFLKINNQSPPTTAFMLGFAHVLLEEGFTPGFMANTDAKFSFDLEYSRGTQSNPDIFNKCLIWATSPILPDFDSLTTSHVIKPDYWKPHSPSGTMRSQIAIWQYGTHCHSIYDDREEKVSFNIDLVKNYSVIIRYMF